MAALDPAYGSAPAIRPGVDVHYSAVDALRRLPLPATFEAPDGVWADSVWQHDGVRASILAPRAETRPVVQPRHSVYVVIGGAAAFVCGPARYDVVEGDLVLAPAHVPHHFVSVRRDLIAWEVAWLALPEQPRATSPDSYRSKEDLP